MALTLLIFGLLSDTFLAVLVGLVGARRRIGLIIALLSDKLPDGERNWGCLGSILAIITIALLVFLAMMILGAAAS